MSVTTEVIRDDDLERFGQKVNQDGGDLRLLEGDSRGLATSVMLAAVAPGSGAHRHRHPHAEIFVLHEGQGRFQIGAEDFDVQAGDVVVIPPDTWHHFLNTGDGILRQTAIHENPRAVTYWEDGDIRE